MTLTSSDPAHFLLSTSATTAGSSSVTVNLTKGSTSVPAVYVQGMNYSGTTAITATVTATTTTGFSNGTGTVSLYPTGFGLYTGSFSTTTFSSPTSVTVALTILNPGSLTYYTTSSGLGPQAAAVRSPPWPVPRPRYRNHQRQPGHLRSRRGLDQLRD